MSTPDSHRPPAPVREQPACLCAFGHACSTVAPGHALHLIQARLASATPLEWTDAIVTRVDAEEGTVQLRAVADGAQLRVWSAASGLRRVEPGTPIAVHRRYHVLAVGPRRFNVAPLPAASDARASVGRS